jgi:anti-anti-sigma factor
MHLSVEEMPEGITCIRLVGRLDTQGAQEIETQLAGHLAVDKGRFILDLEQVSFLASIGIRNFILSAQMLKRRGGKVALARPIPEVAKILTHAGIDLLVPVCADMDAARAAVTAA